MTNLETCAEMMERKAKLEERYNQFYWHLAARTGTVTEQDEEPLIKMQLEMTEIEEGLKERGEVVTVLAKWQPAEQLSFSFQWECKIDPDEVPF